MLEIAKMPRRRTESVSRRHAVGRTWEEPGRETRKTERGEKCQSWCASVLCIQETWPGKEAKPRKQVASFKKGRLHSAWFLVVKGAQVVA